MAKIAPALWAGKFVLGRCVRRNGLLTLGSSKKKFETKGENEIMEKDVAIEKLTGLSTQIRSMRFHNYRDPELLKWLRANELAIAHIFGENTRHLKEFKEIRYSPKAVSIDGSNSSVYDNALNKGILTAIALLESMIDEIKDYWPEEQKDDDSKTTVEELGLDCRDKTIFLAYSYRPEDEEFVVGFKKLLMNQGYEVLDGKADRLGSISNAILDKIRCSKIVVIVMTKRDKKDNGKYTTAAWLLEEKGAAIALGKPVAMFVEDEVDDSDIGGLQGDSQRFHFSRNNFLTKIVEFLECL